MSRRTTLVFFVLVFGAVVAHAESVFNSIGFGRWNHVADPRSVAMGNVSLALPSKWSFTPRNPALIGYLDQAAIHVSVQSDFTRVREFSNADTRSDARLPLLAGGVPIASGVVGGLAIFDLNDPRANLSQVIEGDPDYELRTKVDGAWSEIAFTLGRRVGPGALGVQLGLPLSAFDEEVTREFTAEGFSDRTERHETALDDMLFLTLGGQIEVGPASAGAFWQFETTGEVVSRLSLGEENESRRDFDWTMPATFGVGLALDVLPRVTLAGEWRRQEWETSLINGRPWRSRAETYGITNDFQNVDAWGVGVEWQRGSAATRSVWKRLAFRAGYGVEPWMFTGPNDGKVTDRHGSFGIGIPFAAGNGELATTVRFTSRREAGDQALREDVISLMFGLSFARQPRQY